MEAPVTKKGIVLTAGRYRLLNPVIVNRGVAQEPENLSENEESVVAATRPVKPPSPKEPSETLFNLPSISNSKVKQEVAAVRLYLRDTFIEQHMKRFTTALLQKEVLPYNPYPGFIRRFRKLAEKFHMEHDALENIRLKLDTPVTSTGGVLYSVQHPNTQIWGLEHIVAHIEPKTVEGYRSLLETCTVSSEVASNAVRNQVTVLTSLCGPCVFNNSFYSHCRKIEVKVAVVITSSDFALAAKGFANVLLEEFKYLLGHKDHFLIDVTIPTEDNQGWSNSTFSRRDVMPVLKDSFTDDDLHRSIIHAAMSKKRILSTCLLRDNASAEIHPCTKQYNMMLVQTNSSGQTGIKSPVKGATNTPRLIISTLPYQALHEGLFINKQHAEEYLTLFQKYYSVGQPQPAARGRKAVGQLDPMSPEMLKPILQAWQMKVASEPLESAAFTSIHYMLLMHLGETRAKSFANHSEQELPIQICRFFRGMAARIQSLSCFPPIIEELLSSAEEDLNKITDDVTGFYHQKMLEILDTDLSSRSTEMIALKLQINSTFKGKGNSTYHGTVMPANVHLLSDYISTIILGYTEDALDKCQAIVSLKAQLDRNYHHLVPAKLVLPKEPQFKHGIANNSWVDVDKLKLSRKDCIANLQVPKSVALQYAIMQYASDVRIDETWAGFLHYLLMEERFLPPNPFPLLISHLRKSSMSVHTMFESDNIVVNRMLQNKIVVFDSTNIVYTINGTTAFGRRNALLFLSLKGFRQTSEISSQVAISPPGEAVSGLPIAAKPFQVIPCICLVHPSTYHGTISPYLNSLHLHEHCYIRGPSGLLHKGATVLAKIVKSHLQNLQSLGVILHQAQFGGVILNLKTVANLNRFESEFSAASSGGEDIHISFYFPLAWRYILITKQILVYYVDESNDRAAPMFNDAKFTENREVSIFFHPSDAVHCFRSSKSRMDGFDKSLLTEAWNARNWSQLIGLLVSKAQFLHETSTDNFELRNHLLAFCLRYSNSFPGMIDYIIAMGNVLEGVVQMAVTAIENNLDPVGTINQALVEKMALEYKIKLGLVLSLDSCLCPATLSDFLLRKLHPVVFRDQKTKAVFVKYDLKSVTSLREVNGHLRAVRNGTAEDLMQASVAVNNYLKNTVDHVK